MPCCLCYPPPPVYFQRHDTPELVSELPMVSASWLIIAHAGPARRERYKRAIIDNELVATKWRPGLNDQTGANIKCRTCTRWHDKPNPFSGVRLSPRCQGMHNQQERQGCRGFHFASFLGRPLGERLRNDGHLVIQCTGKSIAMVPRDSPSTNPPRSRCLPGDYPHDNVRLHLLLR